MPRWRVDYLGNENKHFSSVEAADKRAAISEAAKLFHITPAQRHRIIVTKIVPVIRE
jgi:hypothetical protein